MANKYRAHKGTIEEFSFPLSGGVSVEQGDILVMATGSGLGGYALKPAPDAEGETFLGIALEASDNSGGASGAKNVRCATAGTFRLPISMNNLAQRGEAVCAKSATELSSSGGTKVGRQVKYISASEGWVEIGIDELL